MQLLPGFVVNQRLVVDSLLFLKIFGGTLIIFGPPKIFSVQRIVVQRFLVSKDDQFQFQRLVVENPKNL